MSRRHVFAVAVLLEAGMPAWAAGGHHAVDDAAILEPGQCVLEVWLEHAADRRLQHVGPACRVHGVELGLNLDRNAQDGLRPVRSGGLQLKWATALSPTFSLGAVWGSTWQSETPRHAGQSLLLPLTWQISPELVVHVNLGRDFRRRAADVTRRGAAIEWQPLAQWQGLVEWFDDGQRAQRRVGLRHLFSERLTLDLSRAEGVARPHGAWWTLGLNWLFDH